MVKNLPANSKRQKRLGFNSGSGRCPGGEPGNPLQYSCLENPMNRGTWQATVYGVTKSQTQLKWLSMQPSNAFHYLTLLDSEYPNEFDHCSFSPLFFFIYVCVCVCVCVFILNPQSYILWKATGESCTREQLLYILLLWFHFPRKAYILLGHPGKQGFTAWGFHFITLCTGSIISVTVIHDKSMSFVRRCALRFLLWALTK